MSVTGAERDRCIGGGNDRITEMPDAADALSELIEPSDEALAADAARDHPHAFNRLARRYQVPLLRFLLRSTGHMQDAEDGLQETFRRLFVARGRFDVRQKYRPWAFAVARRVAIDLSNDRRQRCQRLRPLISAEAAAREDHLDTYIDEDERMLVWELARKALPEEQVQALWLFHVEEMSAVDIAAVLGRSWVSVKTTLVRARRTLRATVSLYEKRRNREA